MSEHSVTTGGGNGVSGLRRELAGRVLVPGEDGYHQARQVWNAMVDRWPALIARCAGAADVAAAVRYGRAAGLEIGVRCGGHSVLGLSVPEDGLMIDLTPMDGVRIDVDRGRAWVAGGALLYGLDEAAQRYGLATTAGNVSHTGVGGLTLGGGMGWLARRYGLSCDNVTGFELVTADGQIVRVTADRDPELFWGLRGGGGNFGVVTEFEFRLHEVGTTALVTELYHRPDEAPEAMRRWRDMLPDAPPQATFTAWVGTSHAPYLPADLHGKPLVSIGYVWVGDPDEGAALMWGLRGGTAPVAERQEPLSYMKLQTGTDDAEGHYLRRYSKSHYLRELSDEAIETFVSRGRPPGDQEVDPALLTSAGFQAYGGEIAALGPDETAFNHRDALLEFGVSAGWTDPAEDELRMAAARRFSTAMEPFASGVYVNGLADEGQSGVRRAYSEAGLARLAALKSRYDPDNVFRLNHNIRPEPAGRPG